jgi:hypothetical protein
MELNNVKDLVGKQILNVLISPDRHTLVFITNKGTVAYYAEGDCCSNSWFESFDNLEVLQNQVVESLESIPVKGTQNEYDYIQIYGIRLNTQQGYALIEYRNSSNGYCGGWCQKIVAPENYMEYKALLEWKTIT